MKLVCGVGINDADYKLSRYENGERVWRCPFYSRWSHMINRCYGQKYLQERPSYIGCMVCEEWLTFSNFKAWMEQQDWQGKELDKDILLKGNRIYSPEVCVFVDRCVNSFILDGGRVGENSRVGASWHKKTEKFRAYGWDVTTQSRKWIGAYTTESESHRAWLDFKKEQAKILAARQEDNRVVEALINWFNEEEESNSLAG